MDQSRSYDTEDFAYVVCPVCLFWYDKRYPHICLNEKEDDKTLKEILRVLKRIENILERKL